MGEITAYISGHWVQWLFAAVMASVAWAQSQTVKKLNQERKEREALNMGVQALLRDSIVATYNKYHDKGYMPIYARESLTRAYEAYTGLGGNDVAHSLYDKMLGWPTDPEGKEATNEDER